MHVEMWRKVWREGFAPGLSDNALTILLKALEDDDPELIQGATTIPPPLSCVQDWPCEGACLIGYCGWAGEGLDTVGEVEEMFARCCFECDQNIGEPAACRWLLNWYDETPRDVMRRELAGEVELELIRRTVPPLDVAAFRERAKNNPFVPTEAMRNEDWSDHL